MIALPSQLPLLRIGTNELTTYEGSWIAGCIRTAASRAGHENWWIAEDIARAVLAYLQNRFAATAITIEELENKIRRTLQLIGFTDVAAEISVDPPVVRINLRDIAQESGGVELVFFTLLDTRVSQLNTVGARRLSLVGVKDAIKHLQCAKNWSSKCSCLELEIVSLIRHRLATDTEGAYELKLEAA